MKSAQEGKPLSFLSPLNGDCVNRADSLDPKSPMPLLEVRLSAPAGHTVTLNGRPTAETAPGLFCGTAAVRGYRTALSARDEDTGEEATIAVYYFAGAMKKYRVSSDDNILFLWDINQNRDRYRSIFENPYLAIYKKAHDLYGAKVHLNLFYSFDGAHQNFEDKSRGDFDLSMMTDKFKEEFRANSDWLKLAFHARTEFPDCPYQHTTAEEITRDCAAVCREIIRFAGEECLPSTTTVHWGECNREGVRALRALGIRALTGYFDRSYTQNFPVAYYADEDMIRHIGERDFFYDEGEDMLFGRIDLVMNEGSYERVMSRLCEEILPSPTRSGFVSVMIHEQFFYPDYVSYEPDFEKRVLDCCRVLFERGYQGAHIDEVTREPSLRENPLFL